MRTRAGTGVAGSLLLLAALLATSCHSVPANLPKAAGVLQSAAQAMSGVTSTAFSLDLSGDLSQMFVSAVSGSIARNGEAEGSLTVGGTKYPFRLAGGTFYLQNPDGSWVSSPPAFDPTQLLDPTNGVGSLLSGATGARTVDQVSVGGETADEIDARVPTTLISQISDLASGQPTLAATLWIGTADSRLLQFRISFRAPKAYGETVATATLSHFNAPLHVAAPKA
jgi:lipoprotein LprG